MEPSFFLPPLLRNAHVQTLFNTIGPGCFLARRVGSVLHSETLVLGADDGTRLLAEFDRSDGENPPLAVLLHGWEGSSRSNYQLLTAGHLLNRGYDVLRINFRDHGPSHHLNLGLFNSNRTPEVAGAIQDFLRRRTYAEVFLGGYSLGGNFALRIAGDAGTRLGLKAVVAICPPVDPAAAMAAMNGGWFAYERYFFRRWSRSLRIKLRHFPELGYGKELDRACRVEDLNDFFIPRFTAFNDRESYFSSYALTGDRLAGLRIPAHLIASADDPIIPARDLERIDSHPLLTIERLPGGGHCGFSRSLWDTGWAIERLEKIFSRHRSPCAEDLYLETQQQLVSG